MKPQIRIQPIIAAVAAAVIFLFNLQNAIAQEKKAPIIYHVVYGRLILDTDDLDLEEEDYNLPLFGFDAQQALGGRTFKYGIESGALFSWESDVRAIVASGGDGGAKVAVAVDISSLLADLYAGGYLSFEPARGFRLYVGAGPLVNWGLRETESKAADGETLQAEEKSGFGVGVYSRAGIDIIFKNNLGITTGARATQTTLSFEDPAGKVQVEGWEYYFGFVFRY